MGPGMGMMIMAARIVLWGVMRITPVQCDRHRTWGVVIMAPPHTIIDGAPPWGMMIMAARIVL